jgi:hypothetical protein
MKWVGSMITGSLVCLNCTSLDDPTLNDRDKHIENLLENSIIIENNDGYEARCVCCNQYTELYADPSGIDEDYQHYCGGSPRCCP